MTPDAEMRRVPTGVRNLDALLHGGIPAGSVIVLAGPPGSGKTILAQQVCFQNATAEAPAVIFSTLSEPTAKTLRYLQPFRFFDPAKLQSAVQLVDLGVMVRAQGLKGASELIMEHIQRVKPAIAVLDSFKVFDDLSTSREESRKFSYELAVQFMAWECTGLLLGEYGDEDFQTNSIFSVVDGLIQLKQVQVGGEQQRRLQVVKVRGTDHDRDTHPFRITSAGLEVFAPRVTIRRDPAAETARPVERLRTGIANLDALLGPGIPFGSSLLVSGAPGTGKTILLLELIYRGAERGEKGLLVSFEETSERLRATARGLGWDLDGAIERGLVELVFIPQTEVLVEEHLLLIHERIRALGARRVAIDSVSVFLHKMSDPEQVREKMFQLASLVQNAGAVGLFATDIGAGRGQEVSRFGVEETIVDGVILLSAAAEGAERRRSIEVYKLRNTAHLQGRHSMVIGRGGVAIYPRYEAPPAEQLPALSLADPRLATGVPGLDALLGGGLLGRSVTLLSGSAGIGKSTLAMQFVVEGARRGEPGLFISFEEAPAQLLVSADAVGVPLRDAVTDGAVELLQLSGWQARANQLHAILAERVRSIGARRVVLDGVTQVEGERLGPGELRHLLYGVAALLKSLDVTSVLTLEARSLLSIEPATDPGLSPIADNLLILRYARATGRLSRWLVAVKARASHHDMRSHLFTIGGDGLRVAAPTECDKP